MIQKIINNKQDITGVSINGIYYHVLSVLVDEQTCFDEFAPDDVILYCFQLDEGDCFVGYEFTVSDIKKSVVKLYKDVEID